MLWTWRVSRTSPPMVLSAVAWNGLLVTPMPSLGSFSHDAEHSLIKMVQISGCLSYYWRQYFLNLFYVTSAFVSKPRKSQATAEGALPSTIELPGPPLGGRFFFFSFLSSWNWGGTHIPQWGDTPKTSIVSWLHLPSLSQHLATLNLEKPRVKWRVEGATSNPVGTPEHRICGLFH